MPFCFPFPAPGFGVGDQFGLTNHAGLQSRDVFGAGQEFRDTRPPPAVVHISEEYAKDAQLRADAHTEMAEPLADAIGAALTGRDVDDDVVRARAARQAFIVSEHSTIASVTRRPLNRILEDLERFAST